MKTSIPTTATAKTLRDFNASLSKALIRFERVSAKLTSETPKTKSAYDQAALDFDDAVIDALNTFEARHLKAHEPLWKNGKSKPKAAPRKTQPKAKPKAKSNGKTPAKATAKANGKTPAKPRKAQSKSR